MKKILIKIDFSTKKEKNLIRKFCIYITVSNLQKKYVYYSNKNNMLYYHLEIKIWKNKKKVKIFIILFVISVIENVCSMAMTHNTSI
jgi:hypothetical protein